MELRKRPTRSSFSYMDNEKVPRAGRLKMLVMKNRTLVAMHYSNEHEVH